MSTFVILAICLTIAYLIYYAVMIGLDLTKQPGQKKSSTEVISVEGADAEETEEGARKVKVLDDGKIVNVADEEERKVEPETETPGDVYSNIPAAEASTVSAGEDSNIHQERNPDGNGENHVPDSGNNEGIAQEHEEPEKVDEAPAPEGEDMDENGLPEGSIPLDMDSGDDSALDDSQDDDGIATVSLDEEDGILPDNEGENGNADSESATEHEDVTLDGEESVKEILEDFSSSLEPITPHYFHSLTAEQLTEEVMKEDSYIVKTPIYDEF